MQPLCQENDFREVILLRCFLAFGIALLVVFLSVIIFAIRRDTAPQSCRFLRRWHTSSSTNRYSVLSDNDTDAESPSSRHNRGQIGAGPSQWKSSSRSPQGKNKVPRFRRSLHFLLKKVLICWWILAVLGLFFLLASLDGQGNQATTSWEQQSSSVSQRIVFSFTTTPPRIGAIKPVLDELLAQSLPFDAINVIIPRVFRGRHVEIPQWLLADNSSLALQSANNPTIVSASYDEKIRLVVLQEDLGPAGKLLGSLLVETDPSTIIIYGDDDMLYPRMLSSRALYYASKYPRTAIGVEGGWLGPEGLFYCGRSIEFGVRRVSVLGGVGGIVVRRGFYDASDLDIHRLPKACFLGDDFYLSHILARKGIARRLIYDTCWDFQAMKRLPASYEGGLSGKESQHPGGPNVENYQKCMRVLGDDVARDVEFGYVGSMLFSRLRGLFLSRSFCCSG